MVGGLCRGQSQAVAIREEKAVTHTLCTQCQHLYPEEVFVIPMGLRHWALNTAVIHSRSGTSSTPHRQGRFAKDGGHEVASKRWLQEGICERVEKVDPCVGGFALPPLMAEHWGSCQRCIFKAFCCYGKSPLNTIPVSKPQLKPQLQESVHFLHGQTSSLLVT